MDVYTTGEVATFCGVSSNTVKNWIRDGKLGAFKTPGGHFRIEERELDRFLRAYGVPAHRNPAEQGPWRVMVIDDEPVIVELFVEVLKSLGEDLEIKTAGDGYEALIKIGSFMPHLLILDLKMPRVDGLELCRRLHEDPSFKDLKVLVVTGYPEELDPDEAEELEIGRVLVKPVQIQEVGAAIRDLLGGRGGPPETRPASAYAGPSE